MITSNTPTSAAHRRRSHANMVAMSPHQPDHSELDEQPDRQRYQAPHIDLWLYSHAYTFP
jgi:hypothetical protein